MRIIDPENTNIQYVLSLTTTIIKHFQEFKAHLLPKSIEEGTILLTEAFPDVLYSVILLLKSSDNSETVETASGNYVRHLGMKRIKALDFLLILIQSKSSFYEAMVAFHEANDLTPNSKLVFLTNPQRQHIISAMLYLLETYP